ncbi:MAG: hypothetical protein HWE18_04690 [Gammaproteobacteria bacterium]|nr:hypothetical protein [Gammaproteobacteria bacterium]
MSKSTKDDYKSSKFDLQEMLEQIKKSPSQGGSGDSQVSQSDINEMFKNKKKGADK